MDLQIVLAFLSRTAGRPAFVQFTNLKHVIEVHDLLIRPHRPPHKYHMCRTHDCAKLCTVAVLQAH